MHLVVKNTCYTAFAVPNIGINKFNFDIEAVIFCINSHGITRYKSLHVKCTII